MPEAAKTVSLCSGGGQERKFATFCVKGKGWTGKYPCPAYSFCSQFPFEPNLEQEFGSVCGWWNYKGPDSLARGRTIKEKRSRFTACPLWPLGKSLRYEILLCPNGTGGIENQKCIAVNKD